VGWLKLPEDNGMELRSSGKFFILIARSSLVSWISSKGAHTPPNREMLASFLSHADGAFGQIERHAQSGSNMLVVEDQYPSLTSLKGCPWGSAGLCSLQSTSDSSSLMFGSRHEYVPPCRWLRSLTALSASSRTTVFRRGQPMSASRGS